MDKKMFFRQRVGNMEQVAGLRESVLCSGRGRDVRVVDVDNGSGLTFTVMVDRACDIYAARYKGIALAWLSPNGVVNGNAYEPEGVMWLRSFPGGLLTTAGLLNVGGPSGEHGLHGRISNLAADDLKLDRSWQDGEYVLSAGARVRHSMVFGEKLEMQRKISTIYGKNIIRIEDEVENQGFAEVPLMMLYHCNFGYPLVDKNSYLEAVEHKITPKDQHSADDFANWQRMSDPVPGYAEELFFHEIPSDSDGLSRMSIVNPDLNLRMSIAYDSTTLPFLNQWKQMGEGEYVVGLEPGNCIPVGQDGNRERGLLKTIKPGETVKFTIQIEVTEL